MDEPKSHPEDALRRAAVPDPVPRRVVLPPAPYNRVKVFGGLAFAVVVCTPVLFVALGQGDVTQRREADSLLSSRETWKRQHADPTHLAWLTPSLNGQPHYDPPPMSVWLNMLAWIAMDPATATPERLILCARLLAVAMGVLTMLATYWAGMAIGDARTARLATLALGTTLLFVYQVRTASADTHMLAFSTLAVAAGLWAMRPLKEINWVGRRVVGWLMAGLAMGAAVLTQGIKPAGLYVLPPLLAAIALTPRRRIDNLLGLTFASLLGVVAASPWYLYVLHHDPQALTSLFGHALPPHEFFVLTWSHWRVLAVLSPWIVWVVGAWFQPFMRADRERRRQLLIAWFWFLMLFAALSIPAANSPRYLSPLLPAAAMLVGQLWSFHAQLASERQLDPGVDLLRVPHWVALGLASVLGPLAVTFQRSLVEHRLLDEPLLEGVQWPVMAGLGAALLLIAGLGAGWHFRGEPRLAAYATVAWMLTALGVCLPAFARSPENTYGFRGDADRLAEAAGTTPLFFARLDPLDRPPDNAFLYYAGVTAPPLAPPQIEEAARRDHPIAILARRDERHHGYLTALGFTAALEFEDDQSPRRLYVKKPGAGKNGL